MSESAEERRRNDETWLAEVRRTQAGWQTPRLVVDDAIGKATDALPASAQRILLGQSNEVYDVATADGQAVIVRIAHEGLPAFAGERWAMERCRERGLPVPAVLLVDHVGTDAGPRSICVLRKVDGVSLGHLLRRPDRRPDRVARLLTRAGATLAGLHTIPAQGGGSLDGNGRGPRESWAAYVLETADDVARQTMEVAGRIPVIETALAILRGNVELLDRQPPCLLHGDYEPGHIFVGHDDHIAGIIDFGNCEAGDPAYDLAQWQVIHDSYAPVRHVLDGHRAASTAVNDFDERLWLNRLFFRLRDLGYTADGSDAAGTQARLTSLEEDLRR
mgnify:CR=1 FL=1